MLCSACGQENPQSARYCLQCGRSLAADTAAPRLRGERRLVTILFADISGFTPMAEQMDAEEVCRLLNGCFDMLVPVAERYGGSVDKFIGDEIMVVFGAPAAHEDDSVRALHTALDMMGAIAEFNARHGTVLSIHIGINTGLVVAGQIGSQGREQYTVIGDAVNLAARLQASAAGGQILVGSDTYRRTAPLFDFAPVPLQVKGKAEVVSAYRLLGRKKQPGALRGLAGLTSPMVGRDTELGTLLRMSAAAQAGQGGAIVVLGEAGLGKSRLVAEWRAASAPADLRWAQGQCLSYSQTLAYHLLVDLLRSLIGIPPTASEPETRAALRSSVRELWGSARDVYIYLGHLLAIRLEGKDLEQVRSLDPQSLQAQYLSCLRQVFKALVARGPLVLVCEDIHWADPSSIALLSKLLPLSLEMPLLFCFLTRPDTEAPGWKMATATREILKDHAMELSLRTLDEADSRQLIANLLQVEAIPEAMRTLILQRAEGNPFFVEEVIRMLVDHGAIAQEEGHWTARQEIATVEIPDSLQALLMARVDRLPAETRHVLRVAAVIGRQFSVRVLGQVLETRGA